MFAQWWRDVKVLSTFIQQRFPTRTVAASKSHHCANTNVVCQAGHSFETQKYIRFERIEQHAQLSYKEYRNT
jgi:hypothetical protein